MPPFHFPKDARVTTTGIFSSLSDPHAWICAHGGTYVSWNSNITHILVGSSPPSWKLQKLQLKKVQILKESELLESIPNSLWVDAYKPTSLQDVIGHAPQIKDLLSWLRAFKPLTTKPGALLTGPPGIGKTTTAHLVCKEAGYDVVEFNASDTRSAKAIREILEKSGKSAALGSTLQTKRVLILDEVDGMSSSDRGGLAEITRFLKGSCTFPILCIANQRTSPKLRSLAAACLDVRFSRPTKTTIAKSLVTRVVKKEGLSVSQHELENLCEQSGNDIRSIVNSLQFSSTTCAKTGKKDEMLRTDIFSATGKLFGRHGTMDEKMGYVFLDHSMIPLMVGEGYIQAAEKSRQGGISALERCWKAADSLTNWDIIDHRIRRTQAWGLLPAATAAVVQATEAAAGPAPFQIFPAWLGKQSKRLKHRRYLHEIRRNMGGGDEGLLDTRETIRAHLYDSALTPVQVVQTLKELGLTRDNMMEHLVEIAFTGLEPAMETKKKTAITREWNKVAAEPKLGKVQTATADANADEDLYDSDEDDYGYED